MKSPESIIKLLEDESIAYERVEHDETLGLHQVAEAAGIDPQQIVRLVHFKDIDRHYVTVTPVNRVLDIESLRDQLQAEVQPVSAIRVDEHGIESGGYANAPFGDDADAPVLVDENLETHADWYFPIQLDHSLLKISREDFLRLQSQHQTINASVAVSEIDSAEYSDGMNFKKARLVERLENISGLPAMPEMGYRILQISRDPNTTAKDLAKAIEVDPSLSAQIMSYSTSAFYGYQGKVSSVREAISRVLGFELVANLALGIAVGKKFSISPNGVLGLSSFWRHAVYSSAMAEKLAKVLPKDLELNPGMAYLCGLLHNFGYLLIGHLFSPGFDLLNKTATANPDIDIHMIEKFCLGAGHEEIGASLLEQWQMPQETIDVTRWHHQQDLSQCDSSVNYIQLIQMVDRLLWRYGIGDANTGVIPEDILQSFNVDENQILSAVMPLLETCLELDNMASELSA